MNLLYVTMFQLSKYKIYIGHSRFNSIMLSSWLIFNFRGKISVLNLFNTIKMLKLSYHLIKHLVNLGLPVWFVNFDLTKEFIIKQSALKCGEFYLTRRWIRGLVSNYYVISKAYRKNLMKKEYIDVKKLKDVYDKWFFTRFTRPRAVFISDVKSSYIVSKEAASARVPIIALVDTNVKTFLYNIPIGSNDDSILSISFMNNLIALYIIQSKYKNILVWYLFNRDVSRFQGLTKWLKDLVKLKKKAKYKISIKNIGILNYVNNYDWVNKGLTFFFGRSHTFKLLKKKNFFNNNLNFDNFYNVNKILLYNKFKVFTYSLSMKKYKLKWKRSICLNKMEGLSLFKSYLNNYIKFINYPKRLKWKDFRKSKKVSKMFKPFFYFIFFFFLNKFSIVIDSYKEYFYKLRYLAKINKTKKKEKEDYSVYIKKDKNVEINDDDKIKKRKKKKLYDITYIFRYKTKRKYRWKKWKKYKFLKKLKNLSINKKNNQISFFFFFWKYFILYLGLKIKIKSKDFRGVSFNPYI